jgi:hypothetical protein
MPWKTGFWTSFIIRYSENLNTLRFENLICFLSQVKAQETLIPMDPLERANRIHWTTYDSKTDKSL